MKTVGALCAAALAMGLATSTDQSTPMASAEPNMNGAYTAHYSGGTSRWTTTSWCDRAGCNTKVTSDQGWTRVAQYVDQRWVIEWIGRPDGVVCADGSTAPATDTWWWDAQSLVGEFTATHGAVCGNPPVSPGRVDSQFSLTKIS